MWIKAEMASNNKKECGKMCDICKVYIPNEASMKSHLLGKKHTTNTEKKVQFEDKVKRSVYVGNLFTSACMELELTDYFSTFGNVASVTMDKTKGVFALIEFQSSETAAKVLQNTKHFIGERKIVVKHREPKVILKPTEIQEATCPLGDSLRLKLNHCHSIYEQSNVLIAETQLTRKELEIRMLLCQLLKSALQEVFPDCEIEPFGSTVNGFGMHNCDLDINFNYKEIRMQQAKELVSTIDISDEENNKFVLLVVAEIIKQCVPDCKRIKTITNARLPVVRFFHGVTQMRCDISINNNIAVHNSNYLKMCITEYPLFKNLVYFFRFWMKFWKFSGVSEASGSNFNNYAVTMLVYMFLMKRKCLLSLQDQRSTDKLKSLKINGWECSFSNLNCPEGGGEELNKQNFEIFVVNLFEYLSVIDYKDSVLCTNIGKVIQKSDFASFEIEHLSGKKFKISPVNIRDPFELNHNVAGNVGRKQAECFVKQLKATSLACKMTRFNNKPKSGTEDWGLLNLMLDHHNKKLNKKHNIAIQLDATGVTGDEVKQFAIKMLITTITKVFFMNCQMQELGAISINGQDEANEDGNEESICTIKLSKPDASNGTKSPESVDKPGRKRSHSGDNVMYKRAKIALYSPVADSLRQCHNDFYKNTTFEFPLTMHCTAKYAVWQGRRKARRTLVQPDKNDIVELEKEVSKLLLSESQTADSDELFEFDITVKDTSDGSLLLSFSQPQTSEANHEATKTFAVFFHHFEVFLPAFIKKCIKKEFETME